MYARSEFAVVLAMMEHLLRSQPVDMHGNTPPQGNGRRKEHQPWGNVQLSKAERKGRTPSEIQKLRAEKWRLLHE